MKRILKIIGIIVAVLVVILIAIPFFINVNSFRPRIEAEATQALGRQVKVGNLSLSILSGSVSADNISIAEDPAFGNNAFVTAKSLKVGVELMPQRLTLRPRLKSTICTSWLRDSSIQQAALRARQTSMAP